MEELKDDIKRVHEEIERESLFVQAITGEVGKVIVGQKPTDTFSSRVCRAWPRPMR
jgi:hypothetical protein